MPKKDCMSRFKIISRKGIILALINIYLLLLVSCSTEPSSDNLTHTIEHTTQSTLSTEASTSPGETSSDVSIYKERAKLSLSPYTLTDEPLKLFLNMSMTALIEAYGEPISKFYDNGNYVYEYLDFYCYFDGPNYSDLEMMNQDEMIAFAFQFKLTYTLFDLTLGQAKSEIDFDEDTNMKFVSPFKIELLWDQHDLLTGIIVSEDIKK